VRVLPALANEMATACLIAFFFVCGWLLTIDPSVFHSSTSILILLLTTDRLEPFLSGVCYFVFAKSSSPRAMFQHRQEIQADQVPDPAFFLRRLFMSELPTECVGDFHFEWTPALDRRTVARIPAPRRHFPE
jgi:hypothetical protein